MSRSKIEIRWSSRKIAELQRIASGSASGGHAIDRLLAPAQLAAAEGDISGAEAILVSVFADFRQECLTNDAAYVGFLTAAFVVQRLDIAGELLAEKFGVGCEIELKIADPGPGIGGIVWDVLLPGCMRFTFDASVLQSDQTHVAVLWFFWIFPVFAAYSRAQPGETGSLLFSNWDDAIGPGIAMCSNRPDCFLIPDNIYVPTRGYEDLRREFAAFDVPWEQRQPIAFFRGSTTGHPSDRSVGWRSLPRIRLCEVARDHPSLIDAGIARVVSIADPNAEIELRTAGLMRDPVPRRDYKCYKYLIDIDGNTNAWPGFYERLLTGSPVLKVASPFGFRQWYYDRLKPWVNFVPVASDMSDLTEKVRWLQQHDEAAQAIGEQGQALAMSLNYTQLTREPENRRDR